MGRDASQRVNALLATAEQLGMQGQRRDALDLCNAALTIAHAANLDCSQINHRRDMMLGKVPRTNAYGSPLREPYNGDPWGTVDPRGSR